VADYKLVRHRDFSVDTAREYIWYSLHRQKKTIFGKLKWVSVKVPYWDGMGISSGEATGDLAWAKRIAKEYKIKVPKK